MPTTNPLPNTQPAFDWDSLGVDTFDPAGAEDEVYSGCECEQDWNCGLHAGGGTWLETRYEGNDRDEAIANGAWWDV